MKDVLSEENYQTVLLKNLDEDFNEWIDISCLWTGRFNLVKIVIIPKLVY